MTRFSHINLKPVVSFLNVYSKEMKTIYVLFLFVESSFPKRENSHGRGWRGEVQEKTLDPDKPTAKIDDVT